MMFDPKSLSSLYRGDQLFQRGLDCTDVVLRIGLFSEARRCYKDADYMSGVKIIDSWLGRNVSRA